MSYTLSPFQCRSRNLARSCDISLATQTKVHTIDPGLLASKKVAKEAATPAFAIHSRAPEILDMRLQSPSGRPIIYTLDSACLQDATSSAISLSVPKLPQPCCLCAPKSRYLPPVYVLRWCWLSASARGARRDVPNTPRPPCPRHALTGCQADRQTSVLVASCRCVAGYASPEPRAAM